MFNFGRKKQQSERIEPANENTPQKAAEPQRTLPESPSWIDTPWVPTTRDDSPLPNIRRDFELNRDGLYREYFEQHGNAGSGSYMVEKDKPVIDFRPPPDQRGDIDREQFGKDWMVEQQRAAMEREPMPRPDQNRGPDYQITPKGPSR